MKKLNQFRFGYMILAAAFLLSACIPGTAADGTTIDATQAAQMIETAVAQALDAQATELAAAAPVVQATATHAPVEEATNTPIPAPPTLTPFPTITPLVLVPPPSGGGSNAPTLVPEYACTMTVRTPADNTVMLPNKGFDINWTIKNTGTLTWRTGLDLRYRTGEALTASTFVELPEVPPGGTYSIAFDAQSPAKEGVYVMAWVLEGGFCHPYTAIVVKK